MLKYGFLRQFNWQWSLVMLFKTCIRNLVINFFFQFKKKKKIEYFNEILSPQAIKMSFGLGTVTITGVHFIYWIRFKDEAEKKYPFLPNLIYVTKGYWVSTLSEYKSGLGLWCMWKWKWLTKWNFHYQFQKLLMNKRPLKCHKTPNLVWPTWKFFLGNMTYLKVETLLSCQFSPTYLFMNLLNNALLDQKKRLQYFYYITT